MHLFAYTATTSTNTSTTTSTTTSTNTTTTTTTTTSMPTSTTTSTSTNTSTRLRLRLRQPLRLPQRLRVRVRVRRHEFRYMACSGPPRAKRTGPWPSGLPNCGISIQILISRAPEPAPGRVVAVAAVVVGAATEKIQTTVPGIGVHFSAPYTREQEQGGQFWPPNPGHLFVGFLTHVEGILERPGPSRSWAA